MWSSLRRARGRERKSDLAHHCETRIGAGARHWLDRCLVSSRVWPGLFTVGARAADMPLDGSLPVLTGYGDDAWWHERLPLYNVGDGNWVVLAPEEDRLIEDLSRADSLRICGPIRELPRGIGNGRSYRFGGARYTPDELEVLREEAKLLAMLKLAGKAESGVHDVLCRCVPADRSVLVPDESAGPNDMVIDESKK